MIPARLCLPLFSPLFGPLFGPLHALLMGLLLALLSGCAPLPTRPPVIERQPGAATPAAPATVTPPAAAASKPGLVAARFADLPGWAEDDLRAWLPALAQSCGVALRRAQSPWLPLCQSLDALNAASTAELRQRLEALLQPWQLRNAEDSNAGLNAGSGASPDLGLITGYYEPILQGSRQRVAPYLHPLYATPDDLLSIDLGSLYPELRNLRLRGRVEGRRVVPYAARNEIERGTAALAGKELLWVDDAVEAFFLQIQGSGRIRLPDGSTTRVGYADQNGHPYRPIGRWLVEQGELARDQVSMQSIKQWASANPARLQELLSQNPSYVFFRELPDSNAGPIGAQGVALTAERSLAIDPRTTPLGTPVFLATTRPDNGQPLNRLMMAQDTGGAIRGAVRADLFWGSGPQAGELAGRMRQQGRLWLLWPVGSQPPGAIPQNSN